MYMNIELHMFSPQKKKLKIRNYEKIICDLHGAILAHATSLRQAYDMTYDCRSVLKHVLKCYDIFFDVH